MSPPLSPSGAGLFRATPGQVRYPAIVGPANGQVITRHDQFAGPTGPDGTRHAFTEVDGPSTAPALGKAAALQTVADNES